MIVSDCISPKGLTPRQSLRPYEIFKKPGSTTFCFPEIIIVVRSQFVSLEVKKVTSFAKNPHFLEAECCQYSLALRLTYKI